MAGEVKPEPWRKPSFWLKLAGGLLGLAGIVFVAVRLVEYQDELRQHELPASLWILLALLSIVYAASNGLLAIGWANLLRSRKVSVETDRAISIYATSQLGKYIPGNIFQFAGRHALGLAAGFPNGALAVAAVLELVFLAVGGLALSLTAGQHLLPDMPGFWFVAAAAVLTAVIAIAIGRFAGRNAAAAFIGYFAFLILSGICFAAAFVSLTGEMPSAAGLAYLAGAYVLAWLLGLVTPGAPAGLGIRESVLTVLLAGMAPASLIILAVLASRLVTVVGDVLFFAAGQATGITSHRRQGGLVNRAPRS